MSNLSDLTFEELLARLEPHLLIVGKAGTKAAKRAPIPLLRPGSIASFDAKTGDALVNIDGDDDDATPAQVITVFPLREGDRVMTLFQPPHAVFVVGHYGGIPVVAGYDATGLSDDLPLDPSYQTIKGIVIGDSPLARAYRLVVTTSANLFAFTSGPLAVEVSLECSNDGGTTWAGESSFMSAPANGQYGSCQVTATITGSSSVFRPRFRIRARRLTAAGDGTYDVRKFLTSWTVTPQD